MNIRGISGTRAEEAVGSLSRPASDFQGPYVARASNFGKKLGKKVGRLERLLAFTAESRKPKRFQTGLRLQASEKSGFLQPTV